MRIENFYTQVRAGELNAGHLLEPRFVDTLRLIPEKGVRILDVGCGNGMFLRYFQKGGNTCAGIEIHPGYCAEARQNGFDVVSGDIEQPWQIESESFDLVHMGAVIEHVFDYNHLFAEARRVLRPGGVLVISTPNMACYRHRVQVLFGRMPGWYVGFKHIRMWTFDHLTGVLRQHGFEVTSRTGTCCRPLPSPLSHSLRLFPTLASILLVRARRG